MKQKIITILILLMLTTTSVTLTTAQTITSTPNQLIQPTTIQANETLLTTHGPVSPWLTIAQIVIISGPYFKTFLIKLLLASMRAYFLLPAINIEVEDLTFAIRFFRNIPPGEFLNKWAYNTTITQNNETTTYTTKHVLLVSGFTGTFEFNKVDFLTFNPATFKFTGTCDGVLITTN
jgi:hypothetical protein